MTDRTQIVEDLLRAGIKSGKFKDISDAEDALKTWLEERSHPDVTRAAALEGDMTEEGSAEYQDQAMRSVDA